MTRFAVFACALLVVAPAGAQAPDVDVDPNPRHVEQQPVPGGFLDAFCDIVWPVPGNPASAINLGLLTGNNGHLGVVWEESNDTIYVSARGLAGVPHLLYMLDCDGNLLGDVNQHPASGGSWGYRDGCSDGTLLYFGQEAGLFTHEIADPNITNQLVSGGSFQGTWRALAYEDDCAPWGGTGPGVWTANFGSDLDLYEIPSGTFVTSHMNITGWSLYGLAMDNNALAATGGMLWGSTLANLTPFGEIDPMTGAPTGRVCTVVNPGHAAQGGCDGIFGGAPGSGNAFDLLVLSQGTPGGLLAYAIDETPVPPRVCGGCVGDLDGDGDTDLADLGILLGDFPCPTPANPAPCEGDLDGDGDTDLTDLGILLADFPCP